VNIFDKTEQALLSAASAAEIKQAVARLLLDLFSARPVKLARLSRRVMVSLEQVHDLEAKRQAALALARMLQEDLIERNVM